MGPHDLLDNIETMDVGISSVTALEKVRRLVQESFVSQLASLGKLRHNHSHSDILLPPDLTDQTLSLGTVALKEAIHLQIEALQDDRQKDSVKDTVYRDLLGLESRRFVFDALENAVDIDHIDANDRRKITDRLDVILSLESNGMMDQNIPLQIHEDILERLSVAACSQHFDYIESRVQSLTKGLVPSKGKGLTLLRLCNELVRRLSKPNRVHAIFAGRVLTFLGSVLPLGERSGVNFRGDFNTENKTKLDEIFDSNVVSPHREDVEEADRTDDLAGDSLLSVTDERIEGSKSVDKKTKAQRTKEADDKFLVISREKRFYRSFWTAQQWFSNPSILFHTHAEDLLGIDTSIDLNDPAPEGAKGGMQILRKVTRIILDVFGAVERREQELTGKASNDLRELEQSSLQQSVSLPDAGSDITSKPSKRQKLDIATEIGAHDIPQDGDDSFYPKYLTGLNLFEYEIRDVSFRRHILLQHLILFQFLLSFSPSAREKSKKWKNVALANTTSFVLDEIDDRWLRDTWREILSLIRETQRDRRNYSESILQALKRELRWILWKADNCPPIDRPALTDDQVQTFVNARKATLRPLQPYPHRLGTAALSRLWEDGVGKPEPSVRRVEDSEGMEIEIQTDGLDELEMGPMIPSFESYAAQVKSLEDRQNRRRQELGWEAPREYVISASIPANLRLRERERLIQEQSDPTMVDLEQRRAVQSWRAMRMARLAHSDLFGKIQCESLSPDGGTAVGMRIDDVTRLVKSVEKKEKGIPIVPIAPSRPPEKQDGTKENLSSHVEERRSEEKDAQIKNGEDSDLIREEQEESSSKASLTRVEETEAGAADLSTEPVSHEAQEKEEHEANKGIASEHDPKYEESKEDIKGMTANQPDEDTHMQEA